VRDQALAAWSLEAERHAKLACAALIEGLEAGTRGADLS
jgi:hypothetical protein